VLGGYMNSSIKTVAVIGSGVMGAQIAGHLANIGYKVLMLDISDEIAEKGLQTLKKSKPPALFTLGVVGFIKTGNINDNLKDAAKCDWIIEVVPERLDIKKDLFEKLEKIVDNKIITSNTSGISLSILTEGRSEEFKKSFFITHFFNPVRYMKLVELVTGPETDKSKVEPVQELLAKNMGKGVVFAKDTPSFIANRIGVFAVMNAIKKTIENNWPIDLVDLAMGLPAASPKSAIFRTADIVGLDTLMHVAKNTYKLCESDSYRETLKADPVVERMLKNGWLGSKSGQGFYKKDKTGILVLDLKTMEYRPKEKYRFDSIKTAKKEEDPAKRIKAMFEADDDAAKITKTLLTNVMNYTKSIEKEISDSIVDIDNAMKWGYNWELGPFEMMDAVSLGKKYYPDKPKKVEKEVIESNAGASLVNLGDSIVCLEFHSKMNAIDPDIISMTNKGLDLLDADKFSSMVIYNDAKDFSVGANIFMLAMAISNKSWDQVEKLVDDFQNVNQRMRFSSKPVIAAPFGLALGGGCEVCLGASKVMPAAETYMGLVELGVGLIPAGGGCKNMVLNMEARRIEQHNPKDNIWFSPKDGGPFPKVAGAFETIAMAKIAVSGLDAKSIGYLSLDTKIVITREILLSCAKEYAKSLIDNYTPPKERDDILLPGKGGKESLIGKIKDMNAMGQITDYEVVLASSLAHILCGGDVPTDFFASEQDILDLEKEVFLKLCGNEKTMERIQHMLTTGKPLRN